MSRFYLFLLVLLTSLSVQAREYRHLLSNQSDLTFSYRQMGVPMEGKFSRFTGDIIFNHVDTSTANIRFDVDLSSIDVGYADGNEEILGTQWLNVDTHPTATFQSNKIITLGNDKFETQGQLTIKGTTLAISAPFTMTTGVDAAVFTGSFTLNRLDFGIGEGIWSDIGVVANEIKIN
ncbi:MAG TPA: YceI family protein, partial [Thioploca sp.]|nr:YceI family protein [Thioploca sp.]